jgi:alkylation response protein AidB-like acyl-CoA dehydrogenase
MTAPARPETLLEAVYMLAPLIRQHADEAERARRLSQPVVTGLAQAGVFRMLTPHVLGGLEVPPLTFYRVVEEVARLDGSTGWCLFIGAGGVMWFNKDGHFDQGATIATGGVR